MLSGNNSSRARDFPSTGEESFLPVVSILSKKLISSEIFSFVSSQILRKCYSQMSAIFLSWVGNFFRLESNFTQTLFSNVGNFFLSPVGIFFLRLKSIFTQKLFSNVGNFFYLESEIISFVSSQILRKRYSEMSAIFFISSWNFFPSSLVKFYANVILKHRQFFYL